MGNVIGNESMLVEYYTISPVSYKPISRLGAEDVINDIAGKESKNETTIEYSLPLRPNNKFAKKL